MDEKSAFDANAITLDNSRALAMQHTASPWEGLGETRTIDAELFDPLEVQRLRARVHGSLFDADAPERIGRFRVLERVGAGGMGVVYAVYDDQLDRKLAVKLLLGSASKDPEGHARLLREAQTLARLSHPNVVQVHDVGEWQGRVFLAMEFVRGQTLRRWLAAEKPTVRAIAQVFLRAGAGLAAAHREGIVHRDFKPDNVIVGSDGEVKVVDFGVARTDNETAGQRIASDRSVLASRLERALTQTGQVLGTPAYMAPEQLMADASDARADQFSFAVTLFEALYGHRPFEGQDLVALARALGSGRVEIPRSPRVPRRVRDALLRALRPHPEDRFSSMQGLLAALEPPVRRYALSVLAGVVGVGLGSIGLARVYEGREAQTREQAAAATAERDIEAQRASDAERRLREREDAVSLAEARALLEDDPTRALATLLNVSREGWNAEVRRVAADAIARGVAHRVEQMDDPAIAAFISGEWQQLEVTASSRSEYGEVTVTCAPESGLTAQGPDSETPSVLDETCESEQLMALLLSPHGDAAAIYRGDSFEIYVLETGSKRSIRVGPGLTGSMALAARGEAIAVVGDDARLRVYDAASGRVQRFVGRVLGQLAFSPDGRTISAVREDGGLTVWDRGGRSLLALDGPANSPRHAPGADAIAVWQPGTGRPMVWGLPTGEEVELTRVAGMSGDARLKWSADGRTIAALTAAKVAVWDVATGSAWSSGIDGEGFEVDFVADGADVVTLARKRLHWERRTFTLPTRQGRALIGHVGTIRHLATGGDAALWSGGEDGTVRSWNLDDGTSSIVMVHEMPVSTLAAGRDGRVVSASNRDLRTWHPDGDEARIRTHDTVAAVAVDDARDLVMWMDEAGGLHGYDPGSDEHLEAREVCRGCDRKMDRNQGFSRAGHERWRTIDAEGGQVLWTVGGSAEFVALEGDSKTSRYGRLALQGGELAPTDAFVPFDRGSSFDVIEARHFSPRFASDGTAVYTASGQVFRWDPQTDEHLPIAHLADARDVVPLGEEATMAIGDGRGTIWIVRDELPREPLALRTWAEQATSLRVEPLADR
jgi:WD40 repeat protein/predicted Ser/Thr protein kinase